MIMRSQSGLAGGDKPGVVRALGLVKIMVFDRLEVKRGRVVGQRMIGHGAVFGWGRSADIAAARGNKSGRVGEARYRRLARSGGVRSLRSQKKTLWISMAVGCLKK